MPKYTIRRVNNVSDYYRDSVILAKSNHSYFMNKHITEVFNKDSWLGKRCFIVGGGESVKGFDFNRLNGEHTIGINKAFKFFSTSTINYGMDHVFYTQMHSTKFNEPDEPTLQSF